MLVQEDRTQPWHLATELQNNKPTSDVKINFKTGYLRSQLLKKDPALFGKKGTLSEYISDNLSKLAILGLVFLSVLILILVKNRGESPALLCIQPSSKGSQENPFPNVEFKVEAVKDTSKFRIVKAGKWIVVSVSGQPTAQISAMVKMQGWQVLAIGDSHTPKDWDVRGAIFLSVEQQAALKFRVLAHLPFTSHVRKSVGYLFAIQHGAKIIYDADENASVLGHDLSNVFELTLSESHSEKEKNLLQFLHVPNRTTINPYIHFGQRSVWPRGLPLETVSDVNAEMYYNFIPSGNQLILQGLANGFPDVDSIFYHTRKGESESIDIKFDSRAPPVALPRGTMAPINHFNTLFHLSAFWALMLPVSVNPQVSDIFRGFWAQRLLWDIGGYVAIYPPSIYRADAKTSHPFEEEKDLHENVDRLIDFLVVWNSNKPRFFERVLDLSHSLAEAGFWTGQDVDCTAAWLQDLLSVGYTEPTLSGPDIERKVPSSGEPGQLEFVPLALPSIHLGVQETSTVGSEIGNLLKWKKFYGHIVLILECSWPVNGTALGWRMLYGRMFRNVILLSSKSDASFGVEANDDWQTFKLLGEIFERYPKAEGFLFMRDNVILNYWNLLQANKTKLWNLHKVSEAWRLVRHDERNGTEWYYKSSIKRTVKKMLTILPIHFQMHYRENIEDTHFAVSKSDVFYIPQRLVSDFTELVPLAVQAKVHPDLAMPLFFLAMESIDDYDSEAFSWVIYNTGPDSTYTAEAHIVRQPFAAARNQSQLLHVIKAMASGDPLLLEVL